MSVNEVDILWARAQAAEKALAEAQVAEKQARAEHTAACDDLKKHKAIDASRLGRLGAAECTLVKRSSSDVEAHVRVALPWGTLTWDGRLYTSHPPPYVSNHRIEGSELGDVIARTGVALQEHRDEVNAKLAALEKSILDGPNTP